MGRKEKRMKKSNFIEIQNFYGFLATRKEYILTKKKNIDKIEIERTWYSDRPVETTDQVIFPISVEILVIRNYEDDRRMEASITKIQNGKSIILMELAGYFDEITDEEYGNFFEKFDREIEKFKKKYEEIEF